MKHVEYEYEVKTTIELTGKEVQDLIGMAENHYDSSCRAIAQIGIQGVYNTGGWLWKIMDSLASAEPLPAGQIVVGDFTFTSCDLDMLCKVLEPLGKPGGDRFAVRYPDAMKLWFPMQQLLKDLNDEYRRVNEIKEPVEPRTRYQRLMEEGSSGV